MKKILFLLLLAAPAAALELSLEENRGESGTVGYVDIDRVFKEYSGTLNAREEFLAEIKKKEESVNLRKRDIYALKADIARLRQEREFALTLPSLLATQEQLSLEKLQAAAAADAASAAARDAASAAAKVLSGTAGAGTSAAPTSTSAPVQVQAPLRPRSRLPRPPFRPARPAGLCPRSRPVCPVWDRHAGVAKVPVSYFKFSVSTAIPE